MTNHNTKTLISRLVHSIIFLENTAASVFDDPVWEEKLSCFAEVRPLSDCKYTVIEGLNFGNFITEEYYLFKIRYIEGITRNLQISFRRKFFAIKRIINIEEKDRVLNIIAHEIG